VCCLGPRQLDARADPELGVPAASEQTQAVTGGTAAFRAAQGEAIVRAEDDQITIKLVS
jgi:hypothetical protein